MSRNQLIQVGVQKLSQVLSVASSRAEPVSVPADRETQAASLRSPVYLGLVPDFRLLFDPLAITEQADVGEIRCDRIDPVEHFSNRWHPRLVGVNGTLYSRSASANRASSQFLLRISTANRHVTIPWSRFRKKRRRGRNSPTLLNAFLLK